MRPGLAFRRVGGAGPTGLYEARRSGAEIFLPSTGAPISVTSAAAAWTFGAWAAIGTPANDFILSAIHAAKYGPAAVLDGYVVELAYGATRTALDATRHILTVSDPTADAAGASYYGCNCRPVRVPAGQPIYARLATSSAAAMTLEVWVTGWDSALPSWVELPSNLVAGPGRHYPSNTYSTGLIVPTGAGWSYGASTTVVAPAPYDMLVVRLISGQSIMNLIDTARAFQIGYGSPGSEIWCATIPSGRMYFTPCIDPPVWVKAGERLAIRGCGAGAFNYVLLVKVYYL